MSFYDYPIERAHILREEHVEKSMPHVESKHRYWTRAEKKRVYEAIRDRDGTFVRRYIQQSADSTTKLDRVNAAIILFVYLSKCQYTLQYPLFRRTVWEKMCEFESIAHREIERINRIPVWVEYEKEETHLEYFFDLLHVIFQLREVMRR